ncbi:MAG: hypothetical protein V7727_13450 [Sneathiella sp.]
MTEKQFKQAAKYVALFLMVGLVIRLVPIPFMDGFNLILNSFCSWKLSTPWATLLAGGLGFGGLIYVTKLNGQQTTQVVSASREKTTSENAAILYGDYSRNIIIAINAKNAAQHFSGSGHELDDVIAILEKIHFSGARDPQFYKGLSVNTITRAGMMAATNIRVCATINIEANKWRGSGRIHNPKTSHSVRETTSSIMKNINNLYLALEKSDSALIHAYPELGEEE